MFKVHICTEEFSLLFKLLTADRLVWYQSVPILHTKVIKYPSFRVRNGSALGNINRYWRIHH